MFDPTIWKDEVVENPYNYKETENSDGTITHTPSFGEELQAGTPQSATNFNHMETGILAADIAAAEAHRLIRLLSDTVDSLTGFIVEATLTNSYDYPFNNSEATIAFDSTLVRYNKDYTVIVESEAADGFVGDVVVSDKMLNGFKLAYTGSASSVDFKCYIQGGR